jgi:hypothetical protein
LALSRPGVVIGGGYNIAPPRRGGGAGMRGGASSSSSAAGMHHSHSEGQIQVGVRKECAGVVKVHGDRVVEVFSDCVSVYWQVGHSRSGGLVQEITL